jgi:NAD(P)-dependent dehydrogenase (short-subunit alcohol dehydrogenase family)
MLAKNKVALITGAAHRVGKAIALRLARNGAHIVLNYYTSAAAAAETQSELTALGVDVFPVQANVSDPAAVEAMVARAVDHFGRIDILINNAASFEKTPFPDMTPADWDRVINTNLRGPFLCSRAVAPFMLKLEQGLIVNITDLSAFVPARDMLAHSVSKAGLISLTQALALELRPTIRVNAVAPGPVIPPPDYDEATRQQVANRTLLKRWASGDHVARAVMSFVENDYITAEVVRVDGGELFGWRDAAL